MGTAERIQADLEKLAEKEQELRARLSEVAARREELQTALSVFQRYESDGAPTPEPEGLGDPDLSIEEGAKLVMKDVGEPMSPSEIVEAMLDGGFQYSGDPDQLGSSLRGVLSRGAKDGGPFVRVKRGVYGLTGRDDTLRGEQDGAEVDE